MPKHAKIGGHDVGVESDRTARTELTPCDKGAVLLCSELSHHTSEVRGGRREVPDGTIATGRSYEPRHRRQRSSALIGALTLVACGLSACPSATPKPKLKSAVTDRVSAQSGNAVFATNIDELKAKCPKIGSSCTGKEGTDKNPRLTVLITHVAFIIRVESELELEPFPPIYKTTVEVDVIHPIDMHKSRTTREEYNYPGLYNRLFQLKSSYPYKSTIQIAALDGIPWDVIARTATAARLQLDRPDYRKMRDYTNATPATFTRKDHEGRSISKNLEMFPCVVFVESDTVSLPDDGAPHASPYAVRKTQAEYFRRSMCACISSDCAKAATARYGHSTDKGMLDKGQRDETLEIVAGAEKCRVALDETLNKPVKRLPSSKLLKRDAEAYCAAMAEIPDDAWNSPKWPGSSEGQRLLRERVPETALEVLSKELMYTPPGERPALLRQRLKEAGVAACPAVDQDLLDDARFVQCEGR